MTYLRPLQKAQLSTGLSRLLLWGVDCALIAPVPVVASLCDGAE